MVYPHKAFTVSIEGRRPYTIRDSRSAKWLGPSITGPDDLGLESVDEALRGSRITNQSGGKHNGNIITSSILYPVARGDTHSFSHENRPIMHHPRSPQISPAHGTSSQNFNGVSHFGSACNAEHASIVTSLVSRVSIPGTIGSERGAGFSCPLYDNVRPQSVSKGHHMKPRGYQQNEYASSHHNIVDVDRIRIGTDVRTTVSKRLSLSRSSVNGRPEDHASQYSK